jgi:cystathionine gamma-lyase
MTMYKGFATKAIHVAQEPESVTGSVTTPIFQTSTYAQEEIGKHKGFEYARTQNPTRFAWEKNVASLEGARWGYAFGSGMAAIDTVMRLLSSGAHVVCSEDMYGGTFRLFDKVLSRYGYLFSAVDMSDIEAVKAAIRPETAMIYTETPTNPMMRITDIAAMAAIAKESKALLVVDNTFATPYLQKPLSLGADIVLHSATKYLGGHSDLVSGVVITDREDIAQQIGFLQNAVGAVSRSF